jgi:hypothetical protein
MPYQLLAGGMPNALLVKMADKEAIAVLIRPAEIGLLDSYADHADFAFVTGAEPPPFLRPLDPALS